MHYLNELLFMNMDKIKQAYTYIRDYRYNTFLNKEAMEVLANLEQSKGKFPQSLKDQCDNYAKNTLGDIKYAPWLYVYSIMRGEFKQGWIPDNYYGRVVLPKSNGISGTAAQIKNISALLLSSNLFPDLVSYSGGIFSISASNKILKSEEVKDFLFKDHETVIYKLNSSYQGKGIHFFNKNEFCVDKIAKIGSGIFQKVIVQHDVFNELFPKPGATIRLTTVLTPEGKVDVRGAYLRLGIGSDEFVKSSTNIRVGINLDSGELFNNGYTSDWFEISEHPTTKKAFKGVMIPNFKQACDDVIALHKNYPFVQSIGWDVIINDQGGVEIMEWNAVHNGIKFTEAIQGPMFADMPWTDKKFIAA
ncbi:hypothetical protein C0W35_17015 [Photobacterium kishitanii]|nr:hypothetical protein C0W35_17015 [Photobacterium kishitanii]